MDTELIQFQGKGAASAVMHTTMGDIGIEFYPEKAPKAVESFLTHARNGYYDGVIFHRVIENFMIQGGDPLGTGTGGESAYGEPFEDEFDFELRNFRGALCMANSGINTNGSQFFIVTCGDCGRLAGSLEEFMLNIYMYQLVSGYKRRLHEMQLAGAAPGELNEFVDRANSDIGSCRAVPEELKEGIRAVAEKYLQVGGTPHLDFTHTVFGMVTSGMDVVDAISKTATNGSDRPLKDVVITGITVN